jgi:hypothetical protein
VPLDAGSIADLNLALDEAGVQGLRWDRPAGVVRVLLQVLTLPVDGAPDLDCRRALVLTGVRELQILLRRDRTGAVAVGPPIPLAGEQALDDFFGSLTFADAIHDGKVLDDPSPADDWPATVSLTVHFRDRPAPHSLYWFTECGRPEPGGTVGYRLEGLAWFDNLAVERADGSPLSLHEFSDAGRRWWAARYDDDPRVSGRAQRALHHPAWSRLRPRQGPPAPREPT